MTRTVEFVHRFWDADFCGTKGYDILIKKLKDGRTTCKVWHDFLTTRAKIEEEYADKLRKSVKSKECPEKGTLAASWDRVRAMTEAIASEHLSVGREMTCAAERIHEFSAKLKSTRQAEDSIISKSHKHKKDLYNKCMERKKSYYTAKQEAGQLDQTKSSAQASQLTPEKHDKLLTKIKEAHSKADKADSAYKDIVHQLDKARQHWEKDMEHACREFDKLEIDRFLTLRNEMWVYSNLVSQGSVDVDEHCEEIRKSLELVDLDKDLSDFITKFGTGDTPPGKIEYEAFGSLRRTVSSRPPQPLPSWSLPRFGSTCSELEVSIWLSWICCRRRFPFLGRC